MSAATPAGDGRTLARWSGMVATGVAVVAVAAALASQTSIHSSGAGAAAVVFAGLVLWMFASERPERPCIALGVYLGLFDGYLKLSSGNDLVTLGRDVLILAMSAGFLIRAAIRRDSISLPPLSGWVLGYAALVLVQTANPQNDTVRHTVYALRPELEFLPLFFFGFAVMQTTARVRAFFILLVACAMLNGIVALIQSNLSPSELASWGPGYAAKVEGTGDVTGRLFQDDSGASRIRPYGLGADAGAGALLGVVSIGASLALVTLRRPGASGFWLVLLCAGPALAIVTGQMRTSVVAAVIAVLAFVALATSVRRAIPILAGVVLAVGIAVAMISLVSSSSGPGVFDRYKSLSPAELTATTDESRGGSLDQIPNNLIHFPLGGGLGFVGSATQYASPATVSNPYRTGETGVTFALSQVGIPGLVLLLGFTLRLLAGSFSRLRKLDHEARVLTAGMASGIAGILAIWVSGAPLALSPTAPYFWFTAGALSFWFVNPRRSRSAPAGTTTEHGRKNVLR